MEFSETVVFTRWIVKAMDDDRYRRFQNLLAEYPGAGDVIPGGAGLRKIRLALPGRGKRGSARVIYFCAPKYQTILLLYAYEKNLQGDLTSEQIKILRRIVKENYP